MTAYVGTVLLWLSTESHSRMKWYEAPVLGRGYSFMDGRKKDAFSE